MSDEFVPVTGGCLCRAVRYEVDANLGEAFYCHCTNCQKTSGAPIEVGVMVKPGTLKFTKKEPKYYQSSPFGGEAFANTAARGLTGYHRTERIGHLFLPAVSTIRSASFPPNIFV